MTAAKMKLRAGPLAAAFSLLLCAVTVGLWIGLRDVAHDFYVATGGGAVWKFTSGEGTFGIDHYNGWPGRLPSHAVTPVFAVHWAGANRAEWERGQFYFADGTVCLMLLPDGTVSYGHHSLSVLQQFTTEKFSAPFPFWSMRIPYWAAILFFALFPTAAAAHFMIRRFKRVLRTCRGHCSACGYDLTGNISGHCPECGAQAKGTASG